jgi:tetratricopeptide (TPR) repeat protein
MRWPETAGISLKIFAAFSFFLLKSSFVHAGPVDSLQALIASDKEDTLKVLHLHKLCLAHQDVGDFYAALNDELNTLSLARKLNWKTGLRKSLNSLSIIYTELGNFPEALAQDLELLKFGESTHDSSAIAKAYTGIGLVYWHQGNYQAALENYNRSVEIIKRIGNTSTLPSVYLNMGNVLSATGRDQEAVNYYSMSLAGYKKTNDRYGIATCYANLGNVFLLSGRNKRKRGERGPASADFKVALNYYEQGFRLQAQANDVMGIASGELNLGTLYLETGNYPESRKHLLKSISAGKKAGSKENVSVAYENLSLADSGSGDFKNALEHYRQYVLYKDSLNNEESTRKSVQVQMKYEFDKEQAADSIKNVEQVKQEMLKHEQEIGQQRLFTLGGGAGFALMMVVAVVSFRAYRQKQKTNLVITAQKALVEEKQKEILDSIHYAKRIQQSLLPSELYIHKTVEKLRKG